jgi:hypothetical protein
MTTGDDSLIREVDEDLRREHWEKLWKRYGGVVIGVAAAIVVAVAGYQGWHGYREGQRAEAGRRFAEAQALTGRDLDGAANAFATLAADGPTGYALLARLQEARDRAAAGDAAAARRIYGQIISDRTDAVHADLGVLLSVAAALSRPGEVIVDLDQLKAQLEPLGRADNPWRFSAQELLAMLALERGDTVGAKDLLARLRTDAAAPADLRTRADQLYQQLDKG